MFLWQLQSTKTTCIISINMLYVQDVSDFVIIHHNYSYPVSAHIFKISHMSVPNCVHTLKPLLPDHQPASNKVSY